MQRSAFLCSAVLALSGTTVATAKPHEARIPLDRGCIDCGALARTLGDDLHLPDAVLSVIPDGRIDLSGVRGWVLVRGLNHALGDGLHANVTDDALVLHFDPDLLPDDWDSTKLAARRFTEEAARDAIARRRSRYGLHLPKVVDARQPMVIVVHGIDGEAPSFGSLEHLLEEDGKQVAFFGYPDHDSIESSAASFGKNVEALRETFPGIHIDVVAHSMGSLVSRAYVEGPDYTGGIDHLILIAPPNHGSNWTRYEVVPDLTRHIGLWRSDKEWSFAWLVDDVLGNVADELKPKSQFLEELNSLPRREGVKYTIIAGNQPARYHVEAKLIDGIAGLIPRRMAKWWGFRQCETALAHKATKLRSKTGDNDGPVRLESAKLAGVDDFVVVPADHSTLIVPVGDAPPAAWATIRDRLDR